MGIAEKNNAQLHCYNDLTPDPSDDNIEVMLSLRSLPQG